MQKFTIEVSGFLLNTRVAGERHQGTINGLLSACVLPAGYKITSSIRDNDSDIKLTLRLVVGNHTKYVRTVNVTGVIQPDGAIISVDKEELNAVITKITKAVDELENIAFEATDTSFELNFNED